MDFSGIDQHVACTSKDSKWWTDQNGENADHPTAKSGLFSL